MKRILLTLIFLVLIFPIVSAVEFQFVKDSDSFDQGETLLARISGNFLKPILVEDVFFFRGHVRIPIVYDVVKIGEDFYIYALLTGKEQANYSIVIKNTEYMKGIEISEEDLVKNFTITEDTAIFSVNPGFVKTLNDFFIEVQNLQDRKITIQAISLSETFEAVSFITLKSGEIKKLDFEPRILNQNLMLIEISSENLTYQIPVLITINETIPEKKKSKLRFEPSVLDISMATDSDAKRTIYLRNIGDDLKDIFIFVSPTLEQYISLSIEEIDDLEKNSSKKIEIFFLSDEEELIVEGKIIAQAENISTSSTIILNFVKDFIPLDKDSEIDVRSTLTCFEEEGIICAENEKCSEDPLYTKDGVCCLADCKEIKKSSSGKILGWLIVFIIVIFLVWFYKKRYKGTKKKIDLFKIARGKK